MKRSPHKTHHALALSALKRGKDQIAVNHFEAAITSNPRNTAVHLDYARFLTCLFRLSQARNHIQKACDLLPDEPDIILAAAKVAVDGRAMDLGLKLLERIPQHPDARLQSAFILERTGRLEASVEHLAEAEALGGATVNGRLLAARLAARANEHTKTLEILHYVSESAPDHPWVQAQIHYARGHSLDALQEYDAAFSSWSTAKNCLRPLAENRLAHSGAELEFYLTCAKKLTPELLAAWQREVPPGDIPFPVAITGYPRSGTTLMEHLLARATDIPSADENTSFRDLVWRRMGQGIKSPKQRWKALLNLDSEKLASPLADYKAALLELSGRREDSRWIFDKNPQLLPALPIILRLLPHLPVIAIHRDPQDVLVSCFSQAFGLNQTSVNYLSIESAATHYAKVRMIADRLKETLGDQMIISHYESLVADPETEIDRIAARLRERCYLNPIPKERDDSPRVSHSPTYAEVAKPVTMAQVGRWKNYTKYLEPHLHHLEPFLNADNP